MSPSPTITIFATCVTIAAFFVTLTTQSCTPEVNSTHVALEHKVYHSDVVVYGVPLQQVRNTVTFKIRCIFKGGEQEEMIKIYNVGNLGRNCQTTSLPINKPLLVYLGRDTRNRFQMTYKQDPGDAQFQEEVVVICGIKIIYPNGLNVNNTSEKCPAEWNEPDDCVSLPTVTKRPSHDFEDYTVAPETQEGKYEPVKSLDGDSEKGSDGTNTEVKIGDQAGKDGGKKSENMEEEEIKPTTPGSGRDNKASWVVSLGSLLLCLLTSAYVSGGVRG